ncbi:aminotransferase [Virgibacillus profundi]|uniref:Aminotransferase n=1 Tax=Virgibacillus profundi TaxID=2024555 RepID=A0A2A2IBT5_9BACI|nr:GNAT family N-acetyltransferase [Virgibacillus profundi]PAV28838.1 aminotransferase [Virgibacillus profundi]PXY53006.1 aminotransferase class V-fold PLP-dependent enzyme [Virgibacillus profundi]
MSKSNQILYKIAEHADEIEQIHQLNYETFVEEIPQHTANHDKKLVDRFNDENTYIIAKRNDEIIGMIAVRGNRPFSLDQKLDHLDTYLPDKAVACEIRLLSIKPAHRGGRIFYGLCEKLVSYCLEKGYNMALISGTTRQTKLYKHIGFQAFGPLVGTEEAPYQPMYLTKKNFESASRLFERLIQREEKAFYHNFLPGPVEQSESVKKAWQEPAISHRSNRFQEIVEDVQQRLCQLTRAKYVEIAVGTGTLANDMIAAHLSTTNERGLILSNGEFGDRLIDHGNRWGLSFEQINKEWNTAIGLDDIENILKRNPDIQWLWTVHCETSTGHIYPLNDLEGICEKHRLKLCLDACSTVGVLPVDFSGVYMASTVSGKGLGSYPGLAFVFHQEEIIPNKQVPAYLDLGIYQDSSSVPFTHSSNGLAALQAALCNPQPANGEVSMEIRRDFKASGMTVLRGDEGYSPGIITVSLPEGISAKDFGDQLKKLGVHVSYESSYLIKRNWFQLALMGKQEPDKVWKAIEIIKQQFDYYSKEKGNQHAKNENILI